MIEKILEQIGLTEKETKVYLATLALGSATVQQIAKKADVVRPTTYVVLESLLKKGLVTTADKGRNTLFSAEPPAQLEKFLGSQMHQLQTVQTDLTKVLPDLDAIFNLRLARRARRQP